MTMEPTLSSETSAFILQKPGKFPKEHRLHSKHGESLKTTIRHLYGEETTMTMEPTLSSETSAFILRCRGNSQKNIDYILNMAKV